MNETFKAHSYLQDLPMYFHVLQCNNRVTDLGGLPTYGHATNTSTTSEKCHAGIAQTSAQSPKQGGDWVLMWDVTGTRKDLHTKF